MRPLAALAWAYFALTIASVLAGILFGLSS